MTPGQEKCSGTMKVPRTAVEWGFKDCKQTCSTLDFPQILRVGECPLVLQYRTAALIWNLRCCAYGGATSTIFKCPPPTWQEYLGLHEEGSAGPTAEDPGAEGKAGCGDEEGCGAGASLDAVALGRGTNVHGVGEGAAK